uniref:Palmitoyltransferase n=1 Tax=Palpitomonas bilix TaxID=652834 RepID=A0A7S3CWE4_9EUKA|mmetsp:Transcript_12101/g.32648  ORF Transcript_12101/g.32648 Transcript_12101/m.32648 type:complete len:476 (+) Transcript_12101:618-2045(+)
MKDSGKKIESKISQLEGPFHFDERGVGPTVFDLLLRGCKKRGENEMNALLFCLIHYLPNDPIFAPLVEFSDLLNDKGRPVNVSESSIEHKGAAEIARARHLGQSETSHSYRARAYPLHYVFRSITLSDMQPDVLTRTPSEIEGMPNNDSEKKGQSEKTSSPEFDGVTDYGKASAKPIVCYLVFLYGLSLAYVRVTEVGVSAFFPFDICFILSLHVAFLYSWLISRPGYYQPRFRVDELLANVVAQKKGATRTKICWPLLSVTPIRAKYCRISSRLVPRFDHYCIWVDKPIGAGNHKSFMVAIVAAFFVCAYEPLVLVYHCWNRLSDTYVQISLLSSEAAHLSSIYAPIQSMEAERVSVVAWQQACIERYSPFGNSFTCMSALAIKMWLTDSWILVLSAGVLIVVAMKVLPLVNLERRLISIGLTYNELRNWQRYPYMQDENGKFTNPFNKGTVNNIIDFWTGRALQVERKDEVVW